MGISYSFKLFNRKACLWSDDHLVISNKPSHMSFIEMSQTIGASVLNAVVYRKIIFLVDEFMLIFQFRESEHEFICHYC